MKLVRHTKGASVEQLFNDLEGDTLSCLKNQWEFEDDFIKQFFRPFLEGIYLAPLEEQSSRMFHFIWKMFSESVASLPEEGIGAVGKQLVEKAKASGVDICCEEPVGKIRLNREGSFDVDSPDRRKRIKSKSVIVATDGPSDIRSKWTRLGFY